MQVIFALEMDFGSMDFYCLSVSLKTRNSWKVRVCNVREIWGSMRLAPSFSGKS